MAERTGSRDMAEALDWRSTLQGWRRRKGLTQLELANAADLSGATVRAYERGARQPSRGALIKLIRALGIPRQDANQILAAAGYAIDWQMLLDGRYVFDEKRARAQLDACEWPAFMTDQGVNLVATNKAFERVWDVDLESEFQDPASRNFLAGASDPRFARCLENFDEVVGFMVGLAKGDPRMEQDLENPAPWLREAVERFLQGDRELISRVMRIWERAEPIPHLTRHQYEVKWLFRGELAMRFIGITTIADVWNELSWNDWIPADAEAWRILRDICEYDSVIGQSTSGNPLSRAG